MIIFVNNDDLYSYEKNLKDLSSDFDMSYDDLLDWIEDVGSEIVINEIKKDYIDEYFRRKEV